MEQVVEKQIETTEETSILKLKGDLRDFRKETKGRIYDLRFDLMDEEGNVDEAKFEVGKKKILDELSDAEASYKKAVADTREELVKTVEAIKTKKAERKKALEDIKGSDQACTPEEAALAKEKYEKAYASLTEEFKKQEAVLLERIATTKREFKAADKKRRADFKAIKRTPMKRADKAEKLEALKAEIFNASGVADLQLLEDNKALQELRAKYKSDVAALKNERDLVINRLKTLIKNTKKQYRNELKPLKEKADDIRHNYGNGAPWYYRIGLGFRNWWNGLVGRTVTSFSSRQGVIDWFIKNAVYIIIIILVIVTAIMVPRWVNFQSFVSIIKHTAALLPLSLGVAGCIVLTGTDLSIGRIFGFIALLAAAFMGYSSSAGMIFPWVESMPWIWILAVLIICMCVGGMFGAFNGFFVAKFSIHPFVVTLGTQLIVYGCSMLFGNLTGLSVTYNAGATISNQYNDFVTGGFRIAGTLIEWYVIYAIILVAVMWFIWNKTKFGKSMFAVGCNPEAANVSGINVQKTIITTFMLAGIFYGIYGFTYNPINGGGQLSTGSGGELDPITAAVIGGVSFTGGIGKISGVVLGTLLLRIIDSCLQAMALPTAYINIVKGAIILITVSLDMKKYVAKK